MKTFKLVLLFMIFPIIAFAGGECPMHSTMTSASTIEGKFGLQFQYEYGFMKTLRKGSRSISPDKVLDEKMLDPATQRFSAPTEMIMKKYTISMNYSPSEKLQLMLAAPYVINEMDMRMAMKNMMGMVMKSDMTMDTVEGLGDVTIVGIYTLYSDNHVKRSKNISAGLGIKMPTGKNDVKTSTGKLVHAMMQPGTGSWDPIFFINSTLDVEQLSLQLNGIYHWTTKGDEGYEFGDMISADLTVRYQVLSSINLGLGLNFLHAGRDKDHDNKYSKPDTSLIDNTDNTGITAFYFSPEVQIKFLNTGGSMLLRFQKPIYQNVNGIQEVVDWRAMASLIWVF